MLTSSPSQSPNAFFTPKSPQSSRARNLTNSNASSPRRTPSFPRAPSSSRLSPAVTSLRSTSIRDSPTPRELQTLQSPSLRQIGSDAAVESAQGGSERTTPISPPSGHLSPSSTKRSLPPAEPSQQQRQGEAGLSDNIQGGNTNRNGSLTEVEESSTKRARSAQTMPVSMPIQYETCNVRDLVVLIARMLMELVRLNDAMPLRDGTLTRFHSRAPPGISVLDYLQRLTTHATLSPPILLSMVYYIDRLCALYPAFTISSLTVHRFLIVAATVASKGLSDSFWTNSLYARVGGVSLRELALLELEFLRRVEWRIVPKPEVLVDYYRSLIERDDDYVLDESLQAIMVDRPP